MIKNPAVALRKSVNKYLNFLKKRGPRLSKLDKLRFVRDTYLEAAFGWRPFINDIDLAIDSFYKSRSVTPIFEMVKGKGSDEWANIIDRAGGVSIGPTWDVTWDVKQTEEAWVKYYGIYRHFGQGISNSHSYGFAPWEFLPSLYDLIPWSFMVDYFVNIGDIVSSWSYRFMQMDWVARGDKRVWTQETVNIVPHNTPWVENPVRHNYILEGDVGSAYVRKKQILRTPSVELGIPKLQFQCPGFTSQWVNIVALAAKVADTRKALH